jgi:hypothetical protein
MLIKKVKQSGEWYVSFSGLDLFMKCPRKYYYRYIMRLEKMRFELPLFVGKVIHEGIHQLYKKVPDVDPWKETEKYFQEEVHKLRKNVVLTPEDEKEIMEQTTVIPGMLQVYAKKYANRIKRTVLIENEAPIVYDIFGEGKIKLVGKLDNILSYYDRLTLHELKSSKSINLDYLNKIKVDFQTSLYFLIYNILYLKKLVGIVYDVIRKPGIRQKKNEDYQQYMVRLEQWYEATEAGDNKFFLDERSTPYLSQEATFNTLHQVVRHMDQAKTKEDFYQNFNECFNWGKPCEMFELCHEGEKKNLVMYKIREKYQVDPVLKKELPVLGEK